MLIERLPKFVRLNKFYRAVLPAGESDGTSTQTEEDRREASIADANLISSEHGVCSGVHFPMLDIDFEAALIPSSTPGHYHLYLGRGIPRGDYEKLLTTLYEVGIIQQGIMNQWKRNGCTTLRLPWVKKGDEK